MNSIIKRRSVFSDKTNILFAFFLCLFFFLVITSNKIHDLVLRTYSTVEDFSQAKGNMQYLRLMDPVNYAVFKAKTIIPENAKVDLSPKNWVFTRCTARYALYPFELNKDWDFFIDYDQSITNPPPDWKSLKLFRNIVIYAKPGFEFLKTSKEEPISLYPGGTIVLTFLWISAFYVLTGIAVLSAIKIPYYPERRHWFLSTSYLVGFVCLTCAVWVYLLLGGAFEKSHVFIIWTGFLISAIFFSKSDFLQKLKSVFSARKTNVEEGSSLIEKLLIVIATFCLLMIILTTVLSPVWSWDAMSHWIMKSKVIFHHKILSFSYTHSNEYPILWPLSVANYFLFADGMYDEFAKWSSALLFVCCISQIVGCLRFMKLNRRWIWMLVNIFLFGFYSTNMTIAYAENAFYAFSTGAIVALLAHFRSKERVKYIILTVIMAIGLSSVKLEGMIATGIIAVVMASLGVPMFSNKKNWFFAASILSACLLPIGWIIRQFNQGYFNSVPNDFAESITLAKVQHIVMLMSQSLMLAFELKGICVLILFSIFCIVRVKKKKDETERFLFRVSLLLVFFSIGAFTFWDTASIAGQIPTLARIFLHSVPVIIL